MSGHSKWSTIKRKKAVLDSKRGKEFTKLIKEITVAARLGGGDLNGNPRLRLLLDKAKEINMPTENAQRAIKRGTGELPGTHYEAQTYEGYGPNSVAIIVDTLSDNKNRTVAELRRLFTSNSGSLGESGSVNWMFSKMGVIRVITPDKTEDDFIELLLDFNIKDISKDENVITITSDPKELEPIKQKIINEGLKVESAEVEWVAQNLVTLPKEQAERVYEFLSELEDHDDVQNIYSNVA